MESSNGEVTLDYVVPKDPKIFDNKPPEGLNSSYDQLLKQRNFNELSQEAVQRAKKNPIVPIGMALTVTALVKGINAMRKGDSLRSQKMMRYRVAAQGITVVAIVGAVVGSGLYEAYFNKK
ncbi:hypothetical protein SNEBB_004317 [Seison nebaliae]|nr:hypothetical protein SNEBB_004317 [Seison nebaliae]